MKPTCERQYAEFQSIYTWFLLTGSFSGIILDPIHQIYGTLITRIIMGLGQGFEKTGKISTFLNGKDLCVSLSQKKRIFLETSFTGLPLLFQIPSLATTSGIVFAIFYQTNPYLIWASWQLTGLSSIMYIIVNIKELCAVFPHLAPLCIGLVNGLFDASGGLFLMFKYAVFYRSLVISLLMQV